MYNYKLKIVIFTILVAILSVVLFYGVFGFSVSYLSEEEIKENRKLKEDLISSFKINNIETVYDRENNIYYYSIPDNYEGQKYTLKLDLDEGYKYKVVGHTTNIITVKYNKKYKIIIYNDNNYYETKIQLTNLPLISIITDSDITDNDTNSEFKYINPSNLDEVVTYNSKIHVRGSTSKLFDKKSYKLNIYTDDYEKEKNVGISKFYYGSSFILDAMYRDDSKIRNVLSTQLWNDISLDFTTADVYIEYVELFINGEYRGIYGFSEPVNRKNLNLNKSGSNDTSVVVKAGDWRTPEAGINFSNITDQKYLGYELKYPNDEELFRVSWEKILPKLSLFYNTSYKSYKLIYECFNLNNYIDVVIFNSFTNNLDNDIIKNNYFYMKNLNEKVNIQPWDLEYTYGLRYSEESEYRFLKDMEDYKIIEIDINHNDKKLNELLVKRYWELRKNVLTKEYFNKLIDNYKNILSKGAAKRDGALWREYDVISEIEEVRTWMHNRLNVYDDYIRGLENE